MRDVIGVRRGSRIARFAAHAAAAALVFACVQDPRPLQAQAQSACTIPDISGVVWIEGDMFMAVHDAKNGTHNDRPRVSLVWRSVSKDGVRWQPLDVAWPEPQGPSNDLESIARIPGTRSVLLAESGSDGTAFQRIFLATLGDANDLVIGQVVNWPEPVFNVESTAVVKLGEQFYFLYAERAEGQSSTQIRWATMQLNPLGFGPFQSARYTARLKGPGVRPLVSLEADSAGNIYGATAYDTDNDDGPFRSMASRIGQFRATPGGGARLVLSIPSATLATQDGLKIEGVAVREAPGEPMQIYVGTDDEHCGGILRQVRPME